jgi:indole-3-glycerol phosphate synthase
MSDILKEICGRKSVHVAECEREKPLSLLEPIAKAADPARGFGAALAAKDAAGQYPMITEIKRASPSAGLIREDFNPAELATAYEAAGAACLSVLTDTPYFQGDDDHLGQARAACALPVLRKDFMVSTYQITESRALGADCILIILSAVDDSLAAEMESAAMSYGMDVLVETHDEAEFERAMKLQSPLIGINNRDLKIMKTDLATTARLAAMPHDGRRIISESGIGDRADLARLWADGARGFLVGERLMRENDLQQAASNLIGQGRD